MTIANETADGEETRGHQFSFFVDDREFHVSEPTITAGEIMRLAEIPIETGLILIEEDGTQRQLPPDEVIELRPGRRFKRAPRFKRG